MCACRASPVVSRTTRVPRSASIVLPVRRCLSKGEYWELMGAVLYCLEENGGYGPPGKEADMFVRRCSEEGREQTT